jgi:Raf kinase inhibitor-like YbhB/YbcL family protein
MTVNLAQNGKLAVWLRLGFAVGLIAGGFAWDGLAGQGQMQLTSSAFNEGGNIPARHTCDDKDMSPPLKWNGVPAGARSLALIMDDPDAPGGTWAHWVIYGLPAADGELSEGAAKSKVLPNGARQGVNDFKRVGYGGPCPPPGRAHHYFFKIYALDTTLELQPGATKKDVEKAAGSHILAQGRLMGIYQRK